MLGKKYSKDKAPVFTYCRQFKNAIELLSLRSLYGHNKYIETDQDWRNFSRLEDPEFELSNAQFRHALEIGGEEDTLEHLTASAWNAVARLQVFLEKKNDSENY